MIKEATGRKEQDLMGRTLAKVKVRNYVDVANARDGIIAGDRIRSIEIETIVDTGATYLSLPPAVIEQLGLSYSHSGRIRTANGLADRRFFAGAEISIMGRATTMTVMENDGTTPPLLGVLVLEALDFVVDPKKQRLIPNPEHGGEWITEVY